MVTLLAIRVGGTGKLVCPWGFGRTGLIETTPSNKFGGATRQECYSLLNQAVNSLSVFRHPILDLADLAGRGYTYVSDANVAQR